MKFLRRTRHLPSIVTLTLLFLALVSLGHTLQVESELPRQQQSTQTDSKREPAELSVPAPPSQNTVLSPPQTERPEREPRENEWLKPSTLINLALIVVAIWAATTAVDSLVAIEKQSAASISMAETAKLHMYLALRARMAFRNVAVKNFVPGGRTYFVVEFMNAGGKGGPLIDQTTVVNIGPVVPDPDYQAGPTLELGAPCEAGETHELTVRMSAPISQAQWDAINDATHQDKLVIYGRLRYDAGFGQGIKSMGFGQQYDAVQSELEGRPVFVGFGGKNYNYAE